MLNLQAKVSPLVSDVVVKDSNVFVVVDSVKAFKEQFSKEVKLRDNKRRNEEKRFQHLMTLFVREEKKLEGKHIKLKFLSKTNKEGLFRDEKGHFVKI